MKRLLYLLTLLCIAWIAEASAGRLPGIIGPVAYLDQRVIVVADRIFALRNNYSVQTKAGGKLSAASLRQHQTVAVYADWPDPLGQPVAHTIILLEKP